MVKLFKAIKMIFSLCFVAFFISCSSNQNDADNKLLFGGEGYQSISFFGTFEDETKVYIGKTITKPNLINESITYIDIYYYDQEMKFIKSIQISLGYGLKSFIFADVIDEKIYLFFNSEVNSIMSSESLGGSDPLIMVVNKDGEVILDSYIGLKKFIFC